jgi:CHAT domain-containing protein
VAALRVALLAGLVMSYLDPACQHRERVRRFATRSSAWSLAAAALALPLAACGRQEHRIPTISDVAEAAGHRRPIEPRLTGGFSYAICAAPQPPRPAIRAQTCSPPPPAGSLDRQALTHTMRHLQAAAAAPGSDPETLHAAGVASLLWPGSQTVAERAMRDLEAAAARRNSAAILSDLAAAYLVRAARSQDSRDLVRALEAASTAAARDAAMPEAAFNKALALEQLGVTSTAAWRAYLRLDGTSPWAEEARRHLDALGGRARDKCWPEARSALGDAARRGAASEVASIVARFPLAARLYIEEEVLPSWGEAWSAGRSAQSADLLGLAGATAAALAAFGGDPLLADSVAHIEAARRASDAGRLTILATGMAVYGRAVRLRHQDRIAAADELFARAEHGLAAAGNPFAAWPDLYRAICAYTREDYYPALHRLDALIDNPSHAAHHNLRARALWVAGLSRVALAQPAEALAAYRQSLAGFEATGEAESVVAMEGLIADVLRYVGDEAQGWRYRYAALIGSHVLQDPRRRLVVLGEAAQAALQLGATESALLLLKEALRLVARTGNPLDLAEGQRALAAVELQQHRPQSALASLRQAGQELERLGEPSLKNEVLGEILAVQGNLFLAHEPARALSYLANAARLFRETHYASRLADCYLDKARAELVAGTTDSAKRDLAMAVATVEAEWRRTLEHRGEAVGDDFGPNYAERRRRLFDTLLAVLSREHDAAAAFDLAERLHGWDLLEEALALPSPRFDAPVLQALDPLGHKAIQAHLPRRAVLIEYALLADRLVVWAVTCDRLQMFVTPQSEGRIARLIDRFFLALRGDDQKAVRASLEELDDVLLRPVRAYLAAASIVVVVPDRGLAAVPVSALFDRDSGRPLIADHTVTASPSATLYVSALIRSRMLAFRSPPDALVVGDPAFDFNLFPGVGRLPGAEVEAAQVAARYPGALILTGGQATRARLLSFAGEHAVVHLAGHTRNQTGSPLVSYFLLAPSGRAGDSGVLYAHDLLRQRFSRTRLFVLSACESAGTSNASSRRISGFVRPLLATGVPAIVASLWLVDDRPTAELMAAFHDRYRRTGDAPASLRFAQLAVIARSGNYDSELPLWAAFEAFGAAPPDNLRPRSRR